MTVRIFALLSALALVACDKTEAPAPEQKPGAAAADAHDAFTNLSPDEVATMLDSKGCVPVDANSSQTRSKHGVLPGAIKLSSYNGFESKELPEDKNTKLVFYCGGQKCSAAPKAAKLASEAGYADVNVMRAGIRGWVDAGKTVDKPAS
jgi:rhodanese-related sulfurtransferase